MQGIHSFLLAPTIAAVGRNLAWHPTFIPDDAAGGSEVQGRLCYGFSESRAHKPPHTP